MLRTEHTRHIDRLLSRRNTVAETLQYIRREHQAVQKTTEWLNTAAYDRRMDLFKRLDQWYSSELAAIDDAFTRMKQCTYGKCLACGRSIEPELLDTVPETALCGRCRNKSGITAKN